jgi:ubiquinone/menaquinone biosynthesis C-methylase UbiE
LIPNTITPEKLSSFVANYPDGREKDFFLRVWSGELDRYRQRIQRLNFVGLPKVLDAGCGFGQWTATLAEFNDECMGIEIDLDRVKLAQMVMNGLNLNNVQLKQGQIERLPYSDSQFDAIFSYSVLYLAHYGQSLEEMYRVLKPGGKLYFSTNGLGWYVHALIHNLKPSCDYSPRQMAIEAIENTLEFLVSGKRREGQSLVMPLRSTIDLLKKIGFDVLKTGGDGEIVQDESVKSSSFYHDLGYGVEGVYEVLCEKPL